MKKPACSKKRKCGFFNGVAWLEHRVFVGVEGGKRYTRKKLARPKP